jgi:hypothetical protein
MSGSASARQCRTSRSGVLASASLILSNINWPASTLRVWSVSNTGSGPHVSAVADYKLSFAINDTDLKGGGSLDTDIWTNHIIFGLSYRFGTPPSAAYPPHPLRS